MKRRTFVTPSKVMLERLALGDSRCLIAIETAEGYLLKPHNPQLETNLKAGRDFMLEYRETFRTLAE